MTKFVSEKYPQLVINDLGVRFVDGHAEVSDAKAKKLKDANIPGVRAVGGRPRAQAKEDNSGGGQGDGDSPPNEE